MPASEQAVSSAGDNFSASTRMVALTSGTGTGTDGTTELDWRRLWAPRRRLQAVILELAAQLGAGAGPMLRLIKD